MATAFCLFSRQSNATLIISYRTATFGFNGGSSIIYYRINEGPWQAVNNIQAYVGSASYLTVVNTTIQVNDKVDYYFANTFGSLSYGLGFNGGYFGYSGIYSTTMSPGTNNIYFNICSQGPQENVLFCNTVQQ